MKEQTILVVDDEPSISEVVSLYLRRAGYTVCVVHDGRSALAELTRALPDLVVLDIMLPQVDGLEITRRLRAEGDTPIILLTARSDEADRVAGLELGADDYVVKPFSPQELVSRVRAVLRRIQHGPRKPEQAPNTLVFDGLRIDAQARQVQHDGAASDQAAQLTVKEFDLLWFLASHPQRVFSRTQLLAEVWGDDQYIDPSTVTVHIRRLREKLEADPAAPQHIQTVWGVGYKFEP